MCSASLYIAVSPVVRITVLRLNRPRGPACSMNASRSPSQKLECTTSALAPSTVEISALYCPAKSFGICEVATWTPGVSCFIDASKSTQESWRSEEHTSELQSRQYLVCRLLLEKKKKK